MVNLEHGVDSSMNFSNNQPQQRHELLAPIFKDEPMSSTNDSRIAAADVLTLLLHNQHAIAAAIEELSLRCSYRVGPLLMNAITALKPLARTRWPSPPQFFS
jgi:hypothetical protein